MTVTSARQGSGYLQSLTPVRGLAALWVAVYHCAVQGFPSIHAAHYTNVLGKGYLAVDLFFLLSGFVLTHVYHDTCGRYGNGKAWDFFKARIARLYPLHLFVLGLFVMTTLTVRAIHYLATGTFQTIPLEGARSLSALLANLFMLQGLQASTLSWNYPAWSISVEFAAYLVFPLALPLIWQAGPRLRTLLTLAILGAIGWLSWLTRSDFNQWDGPLALLRCLPEFLLGALIYHAYRNGRGVRALATDAAGLGLAAALLVLLHIGAPDPVIVLLFAALIVALVANTGRIGVALNAKALVWLGEVSYAFYLIHGFVQEATMWILAHGFGVGDRLVLSAGGSMALTATMIAATLVFAALAHRHIEIPGRDYLHRAFSSARRVPEGNLP